MPEILSIGELLDLGNSASTAGLIPYSALEYNGSGNISGISGSAIAGGVDTTVVSSIARSYVESGISSKVDQSAFDDCCSSVQSALSGKLDKSASSQFAPNGDYVYESSYSSFSGDVVNNMSSMSSIVSGLTGEYIEASASSMFQPSGDYAYNSSLSSYALSSSMSSYALSSDVSGVIYTVSNNSGSWGGGGAGNYVEKSATAVTIGSANTADWYSLTQGAKNGAYTNSFAQGSTSRASSDSLAQGYGCSAVLTSLAQGRSNVASEDSLAQGNFCSATVVSFSQGEYNSANGGSFAQGTRNVAANDSLVQGSRNSAVSHSVAFGQYVLASSDSFAHGTNVSANNFSFADGCYLTAQNSAWVIGHRNLHGDGDTTSGDSAAFVIGDGVDHLTGRHDLMLVTRDGEITMYSSTADTTGIKLVNTLKALSAWATANGWTGTP